MHLKEWKDQNHEILFKKLAKIILTNYILLINKKKFRIAEIEIYYRSKNHDDTYVHCDEDQLKYGYFYFHKYKNGTYKNGTWKGMDITFGNGKDIYFGILIRSIYDIKNDTIVEGPCKVVNKILELYNVDTINNFTNNNMINIFKNDKNFILVKQKNNNKIYMGTRIGLSDKNLYFKNKIYRFVIFNNKIKKNRKKLIEY